jgi:hypothetical protein
MLTLIKEDGTARADANAYASVADGDAYHEGHLYATAWTAATAEQKAAALVMASRLIDSYYQFGGVKVSMNQGLQWPRYGCPDPDATSGNRYVLADLVPVAVRMATCEMARELIVTDRTAAPAGEGLKYANVGPNQTGYDPADRRPVISQVAQAMLSRYGSLVDAKSGVVKLVRT